MFGSKRSGASFSLKDKTDNLYESQWAPGDPSSKNPAALLGKKHQNDPATSQRSLPQRRENEPSYTKPDRGTPFSQATPDGPQSTMHPDRAAQLAGKRPVNLQSNRSPSPKKPRSPQKSLNEESTPAVPTPHPATNAPSNVRVDEDGDIVMEDINDPVVLDQIAEQLAYERKYQEENVVERKDIKYPTPKKQPASSDRSPVRCVMVVDTCFILSQLHLLTTLVEAHRHWGNVVIIPWAVIMELDGLKLSSRVHSGPEGNIEVSVLARRANNWAFERLGNAEPGLRGQTKDEYVDREAARGDEAILDCCRYMKEKRKYNTALLSNDKNLCVKALIHGIKTVTFLGQRLHPEDVLATVVGKDAGFSESTERFSPPPCRPSPSPPPRWRAGAGVPIEPRSSEKRGRSMSPGHGSHNDGRYNDSKRNRCKDRSRSARSTSRTRRASVSGDCGSTKIRRRSPDRRRTYGTPLQGDLASSVYAPNRASRRDPSPRKRTSPRRPSLPRGSNTAERRPVSPSRLNIQEPRFSPPDSVQSQGLDTTHKKREPDGDVMMDWASEVSAAIQRGPSMPAAVGLQDSIHGPRAVAGGPSTLTSTAPTAITIKEPCPHQVKKIKRAYEDLFNVIIGSILSHVPRLLDRAMSKALGGEDTLRYLKIPSATKLKSLAEIEAYISKSWFTVFSELIPGGRPMEAMLKQGKRSRQLVLWLNWTVDRFPQEEATPEEVSKWTDVWSKEIWGGLCDCEKEKQIREEEYAKWVKLARRILETSE